jgi:RNA polymerase sigma-70 factor (ECF subfamily)
MDGERDRSDRQVIREVLQGQTQAFARLVETYKGPVFNLAFRMTGSRQDAEDLAQETFLKAYLGLKQFNVERRFFPWLFTIAVNTVRNHLKKKTPAMLPRSDAGEQGLPAGPESNPERRLVSKQQSQTMAVALAALPLQQREVVVLRYFQDLPFDDIAAVCGVPLSTAKMRVYRGIEHLARIYAEKDVPNDSSNRPQTEG